MSVKNNFNLAPVTLAFTLMLVPVACKKKQAPPPPPVAMPAAPAPKPTVSEEPKEKPVYVYAGDHFRDPFVPAGQATSYQPEAVFDPQRSVLKAVVYGSRMRTAVLQVTGAGSYFVKDSKIFDVMGKPVKGFTAKVQADRVIVTGETENVYEIKLKDDDEEAKNL